jgi:protein-tyrosine phosphatase
MAYLVIIGLVIGAWALLRLMGAERESRLRVMRDAIAAEAAAAAEKQKDVPQGRQKANVEAEAQTVA